MSWAMAFADANEVETRTEFCAMPYTAVRSRGDIAAAHRRSFDKIKVVWEELRADLLRFS